MRFPLRVYACELMYSRTRWWQIELKKRESIIFWCVGRPLPDGYQRCIKRLPIDKQEIIREKLTKVERHGSTVCIRLKMRMRSSELVTESVLIIVVHVHVFRSHIHSPTYTPDLLHASRTCTTPRAREPPFRYIH